MNPGLLTLIGRRIACALVLLLGGLTWLHATPAEDFEAANRLFEQGKFTEAAVAYQKAASTGRVSAALLYNEGNAWFKSGQLGRAISAYSRALALAPRDPDTRANLRFAREKVAAPTAPPGGASAWFSRLTLNEWGALAAVVFWVCFGLLAAAELAPAARGKLRRGALWAGAGFVVLALATGLAWRLASSPRVVVVVKEAVIRSGPLEDGVSLFTVSDGAELPVRDRKGEWFEVSDGKKRPGWIRANAVEVLGRVPSEMR